jgi:orotate phosphoribosyltransferase
MASHIARGLSALKKRDKTVGLAFSGTSGALYAANIGERLKKRRLEVGYLQVRKDNEGGSHRQTIEGGIQPNRTFVIFVDDFISSGHTLRHVCYILRERNITIQGICCTDGIRAGTGFDDQMELLIGDTISTAFRPATVHRYGYHWEMYRKT